HFRSWEPGSPRPHLSDSGPNPLRDNQNAAAGVDPGAITNSCGGTMTKGFLRAFFICASPLVTLAPAWAAGPPVAADAYVQGGTSGNTNFGTLAVLKVGPGSNAAQPQNSYVKWDLSTYTGVDPNTVYKATAWFYVGSVGIAGSMDVYAVNGGWSE